MPQITTNITRQSKSTFTTIEKCYHNNFAADCESNKKLKLAQKVRDSCVA